MSKKEVIRLMDILTTWFRRWRDSGGRKEEAELIIRAKNRFSLDFSDSTSGFCDKRRVFDGQ